MINRKKKETVTLPLNHYDKHADNSKSKKLHTTGYKEKDAAATSHKNQQEKVASSSSNNLQTIDNILNSFNDSTETNHDDENINYNNKIAETEFS
ncbi:18343_t:CDS:2 [Racocetra persica]|uniref:18343_t:CDS:1 n=1 Tax=Racocetra persica TaxID=160502 RepID=A0ACA9QHG2_9GLOM|nr:18343_t:CDS:2 [Racocetra persica]